MKHLILIALTSLGIALPVLANPFRNLGFEEVNPAGIPNAQATQQGLVTDLLPGWQVFNGTNELTTIGYDYVPISLAQGFVSLISTASSPVGVPEGQFALHVRENFNNVPPFTIQQRGDIPSFAHYLYVTLEGLGLVEINGQPLLPLAPGVTPTPLTTEVYDISMFTGQKDTLLSLTTLNPPGGDGGALFDDLVFAVPEPATTVLFAFGAVGLAWQICRQHAS